MARRHLQLSPDEWEGLSWDIQRVYVEGMIEEQLLAEPDSSPQGEDMIAHRTAEVDADVIDLAQMQADLMAARGG
jgi:hypothetical protein